MEEIMIINDIIVQATIHGGDAGGSYDSNEKGLTQAIQKYLQLKGYEDEFFVVGVSVHGQCIPQILRRFEF